MNYTKEIEIAKDYVREFSKNREDLEENLTEKVLTAFRNHRVADMHLKSSTGYGYDDVGRDTLEEIVAEVFKAESALLRQQIASGTHAISLALFGALLPGDEYVSIGTPYDTLQKVIGAKNHVPCSLVEMGVRYREIDVDFENISYEQITSELNEDTKLVGIQRSRGYIWRNSLSITEIGKIIEAIRKKAPKAIVFVDNCYGEFVEDREPLEVGADMIAGSLIKNAGGGLAPSGGYIAGRKDLVDRAAARLTAPGIAKEVGSSLSSQRLYYQGFFMAPMIVGEALRGAVFTAALFNELGFEVSPKATDGRYDIIQGIRLGTEERLNAFCRGIQKYAPVDSYVTPVGWDMPGYNSKVIMAAGTFVQGASIELSADAPVLEPFNVFLQGGLSHKHTQIAVTNTLYDMAEQGLL